MERGRQIRRQWSLLDALRGSRYGLTIEQLIEAVGDRPNRRTIYRDLKVLGEARFELRSDNGRWHLVDSPRGREDPTPVVALQFAESLLRASGAGRWAGALSELRTRLRKSLSAPSREYCDQLSEHAVISTVAPTRQQSDDRVISTIERAISHRRALRIEYEKPNGPASWRVVEAQASWLTAGRSYLVAWCREAGAIRTFALQRIRGIELLEDEPVTPRPDFDLQQFAQRGFGVYHGEVVELELEFDADLAYLPHERQLHASQQLSPLEDGRVRVTMTTSGIPEIAAWVASFGGGVRALRPPALRDEVRRRHERGLAAHADPEPSSPPEPGGVAAGSKRRRGASASAGKRRASRSE